MKQKNKLQKQIAELSFKIAPINDVQEKWAFKNCFKHYAIKRANGTNTCMECGHSWKSEHNLADSILGCTCPSCGARLEALQTRKSILKQVEYFCVVTTFRGWQVIRYFYLSANMKKGSPAEYSCTEVIQRWMDAQGKPVVLARLRALNYCGDAWCFGSDLEIRNDRDLYDILPTAIYPRQSVLSEIKRNGFKGEYHDLTPYEMFHSILTNSKAETLLKAGQYQLLRRLVRTGYDNIERYWGPARICIRNGYIVKSGSMWCDYIDMLRRLGKDTHNAHFVCPDDLKEAHDRVQRKLQTQLERKVEARKRQKALENEARFQALKAPFFGIAFTDGTIEVRVLESVQEYMEEGLVLHHCVFDNAYYLKENSLILSACINGKRIETIEVSLETLKVVQSRGVQNTNTEYHDRIVRLVDANMYLIRERMTA